MDLKGPLGCKRTPRCVLISQPVTKLASPIKHIMGNIEPNSSILNPKFPLVGPSISTSVSFSTLQTGSAVIPTPGPLHQPIMTSLRETTTFTIMKCEFKKRFHGRKEYHDFIGWMSMWQRKEHGLQITSMLFAPSHLVWGSFVLSFSIICKETITRFK